MRHTQRLPGWAAAAPAAPQPPLLRCSCTQSCFRPLRAHLGMPPACPAKHHVAAVLGGWGSAEEQPLSIHAHPTRLSNRTKAAPPLNLFLPQELLCFQRCYQMVTIVAQLVVERRGGPWRTSAKRL
jgi:hypothetical protein